MQTLTMMELASVQHFVDRTLDTLDQAGLALEVDDDLRNWAEFLRHQPATHGVTTTHDPARSHVHPGNSFWVAFRDASGQIVACEAHRTVDTDDFLYDIQSHRIFFDRRPVVHHYPLGLCTAPDTPRIAGRVGIGGGLWVSPARRGRNLNTLLTGLIRALSLRHFQIDWDVAFMLDTPVRARFGRFGFGYTHRTPLMKGLYPPYGSEVDIQLVYMDRAEIMAQIAKVTGLSEATEAMGLMRRNA